jgi:hypothetical protein
MGTRKTFQPRPRASEDGEEYVGCERRGTVVIVDAGADAELLVFPPEQSVGRGVEFDYRGTTWVITGAHRDSGVLVAEPVLH